jgi:carboxypeptidase Taq
MDENFGIIPKNDKDGVLQDMHWSGGSIGYFPTYAIGTIYSSQLFNQLKKEQNKVEDEIRNGDFSHIIQWLNSNVYRYGRIFNSENLIKKTCGEGLNSKVFIEYIRDKYFGIYDV